jgi:hypothetical protein
MRGPSVFSSFGTSSDFIRLSVRGTRSQVLNLRQGIALLLKELTADSMTLENAPAFLETEVAAQHHTFIMGKGNSTIRAIQQMTGAVITFPENLPTHSMAAPAASTMPMKRSTVTISGCNFDSVYLAWQELVGNLPLLLIFDLREGQDLDAALITQLTERMKVSILIKPKLKQNFKSIMVRGAEKESRILFEVRRQLMGLTEAEVPYCCQQHQWGAYSSVFSAILSTPTHAVTQSQKLDKIWQETTSKAKDITSLMTEFLTKPLASWADRKFDYPLGYEQIGRDIDSQFKAPELYDWKISPTTWSPSTASETTPEADFVSNKQNSSSHITSTPASTNSSASELNLLGPFDGSIELNNKLYWARMKRNETVTPSMARTPTDRWQGFSRSMPAHALADLKDRAYDRFGPREHFASSSSSIYSSDRDEEQQPQHEQQSVNWNSKRMSGFSQSNYFDYPLASNTKRFTFNQGEPHDDKIDLAAILAGLGLSQYLEHFEGTSLSTFLTLNEPDLVDLGINTSSGRYKVLTAIKHLQALFRSCLSKLPSNSFDVAPGAGRNKQGN